MFYFRQLVNKHLIFFFCFFFMWNANFRVSTPKSENKWSRVYLGKSSHCLLTHANCRKHKSNFLQHRQSSLTKQTNEAKTKKDLFRVHRYCNLEFKGPRATLVGASNPTTNTIDLFNSGALFFHYRPRDALLEIVLFSYMYPNMFH